MRRISRDNWLLVGLLLLLLFITMAVALWQLNEGTQLPTLMSLSDQPDGASALRQWMEELGYQTGHEMPAGFAPPPEAALFLMLEPDLNITEDEWGAIDEWVEAGGTLLVAGQSFGAWLAFEHFEYEVRSLPSGDNQAFVDFRLKSPPITTANNARPQWHLQSEDDDVDDEELLRIDNRPLLLTFPQGQGRVVLTTLPYPFTNAGLKETGNPELALNLISLSPRGGTIWFDEWHHGLRELQEVPGPAHWLRQTAAGRALLYAAGLLLLFIVLRGRRFGRPLPLPESTHRRAPLEHITALAQLSRRAGHRRAALDHYYQQLKRHFGRRYHLDPSLPDDEYVTQLATLNPNINRQELARLLARLQAQQVSESELLHLAQEVNEWLTQ